MTRRRDRQRGFTLIEILLATALLAAGLALAFATLRAAGATAERGEALAQLLHELSALTAGGALLLHVLLRPPPAIAGPRTDS